MKSKGLACLFSLRIPVLMAAMLTLAACGNSDNTSANSLPVAGSNQFTVQSGKATTYGVNVSDADGDDLTYAISVQPIRGTATIDDSGTISYQAANYIGADTITVDVSDGTGTVAVTVAVTLQAEPAFDYQFYRVANPNATGSYQIVRYDPNDDNKNTNQVVIKQGAILSDKVFVMSGAKQGDQTVYLKREYGVFLDQSASSEIRRTNDDPPKEYTFYTDSVLKRFDARNTNVEYTIFQSSQLTAAMKAQGVKVISGEYKLHTTEADIDNSYVQLKAFDKLPDLLLGETEGKKKQLPIVVRIKDSSVVNGRMISTIVDANGAVQGVLLNELGAYDDSTLAAVSKSLKLCNPELTNCKAISSTDGSYHYLAGNDSTIYMAKEGDTTIYAYAVADGSITAVSGVAYPAPYDAFHHQIAFNGGHRGGSGIFNNLYNMPGTVHHLAAGDTSYLLINYNLDTQDASGTGNYDMLGFSLHVPKNAMILKLTGNTGVKVYDNGNGTDLMNNADNVPVSWYLSLVAVKNDYLYVEANRFVQSRVTGNVKGDLPFDYQSGWLNTATTTPKTALDNVVVDIDIPYFTGVRIPPVAVSGHIYVNEVSYLEGGTSGGSANRIYNIYKMPIDKPTTAKGAVEHITGRMYFERSAYSASGIYEGNVLLWDLHNKGTVTNATTGKVMGVATVDVDEGITNVYAGGAGNDALSGVGGLFGLHMTPQHGDTPFLASGESAIAGSLKTVNQINANWIID